MPESIVTLIKGDKHGSETDYRDQLPVNMSAVIRPMFGAEGYMLQEPGLVQYGSGSGVDRRGIWNDRFKEHYRVSGFNFISVDENGVENVLATVLGSDTVSLPYSFNTQGIVASGNFYLYDNSNGFRQVTDPDIRNPIDCVWVDGYYFFTDGEFLYHTDIDDEESINPTAVATAEFMPDDSLGLGKTSDNKVIVFGRYTTEYFFNAENDAFAFQRVPTRATKTGIVGTHAKCELNNKWYMLGGRKEGGIGVFALEIGEPTRVSTREIEKIIGQYTEDELKNVVLESRTEDAYSYVIVHLPSDTLKFNETLAKTSGIDIAWSVLKSDVLGNQPWRAKFGIYEPRIGKWVYGDKNDNRLGILDETVSTQYDEIVEWLLFTPFIQIETAAIDKLEAETIPGFTGSDDATVFMSLTYNGVTYGKEWTEMYGLINDYSKRFILRRLGYVNDWVGVKLRGATRSRMAFHRMFIGFG